MPTKRTPDVPENVHIITDDEEYLALNQNKPPVVVTELSGSGDTLATGRDGEAAFPVTHKRPDRVQMFKPDGRGHFTPRVVSVTAMNQNLKLGWRAHCPECYSGPGTGDHGPNPNDCLAREMTMARVCPICPPTKLIFDNMDLSSRGDDLDGDVPDYIIQDASFDKSTPFTRTKALLEMHILAKHPTSARMMGLSDTKFDIDEKAAAQIAASIVGPAGVLTGAN